MAEHTTLEDGAMPDTTLPIHPRTGLRAVGIVGGRPVWPIRGGSTAEPPTPPAAAPPAPAEPSPPAPGAQAAPAEDPMSTDAGRRALAAERQRAADEKKRADELDARLKAIEDKDRTELERATARLSEIEEKYATSEAQRLRLEVATEHHISAADLVLMTGTTRDELTAQAIRIAALNAGTAAATAPPAFAANPGQAAGNGTPAGPSKATLATGAELYQQRKPKPKPATL